MCRTCLRCNRTPGKTYNDTFWQCLNKIMAVSLSSISLRSELQASSDEELSCELELFHSEVDRYRFGRFANCLSIRPGGSRFPALQSAQATMCQHIPARMQKSDLPTDSTSSARIWKSCKLPYAVIHDYFWGLKIGVGRSSFIRLKKVTWRVEHRDQLQGFSP